MENLVSHNEDFDSPPMEMKLITKGSVELREDAIVETLHHDGFSQEFIGTQPIRLGYVIVGTKRRKHDYGQFLLCLRFTYLLQCLQAS